MTSYGAYTNAPASFAPDQIDSLIGWYDSNSAVFSGGYAMRWNDKSEYSNTLYPGTTRGFSNNFYFSNVFMTNNIEFKYRSAGATVFIVWKSGSNGPTVPDNHNLVNIFTSNFKNPGYFTSNFTVARYSVRGTSNFFIQTSGLSNFSTYSNILAHNNYNSGLHIINGICFTSNFNNSSRAYVNGTVNSSNSNRIILSSNINNFKLTIGDNFYTLAGMTHEIREFIYEVLVYNSVLSQSQISQVNRYLQAKNGTAALANSGNFTY
jgi:hypothetical protein